MACSDLGDHLADHIIQVEPRLDIWYERSIFSLDCIPVAPVHILKVITVAESPPHFVEYLGPVLAPVHSSGQMADIHRILEIHPVGREVRRRGVLNPEAAVDLLDGGGREEMQFFCEGVPDAAESDQRRTVCVDNLHLSFSD